MALLNRPANLDDIPLAGFNWSSGTDDERLVTRYELLPDDDTMDEPNAPNGDDWNCEDFSPERNMYCTRKVHHSGMHYAGDEEKIIGAW